MVDNITDEVVQDDIQLAENLEVDGSNIETDFVNKRQELDKTKISKQTWSIREIIKKIKAGELDLKPNYQRNVVWDDGKQVAFIESLLMGIIVPPLYFVEIPGKSVMEATCYEVVDGKQRLNSIYQFVNSNLVLQQKYLEYFGDKYKDKKFSELSEQFEEEMEIFASQTLDIYVITASSPVSTKYDIFSRLNKGAEPLRVNEIRKAVYHSDLIEKIDEFVNEQIKSNKDEYSDIFSDTKIKRYVDYGVFYKSIAFYLSTDEEDLVIKNYNSRPRELINNILSSFQKNTPTETRRKVSEIPLDAILKTTLEILSYFKGKNSESFLECCIKIAVDKPTEFLRIREEIKNDSEINESLEKSKSTTSKVNSRVKRVYSILNNRE